MSALAWRPTCVGELFYVVMPNGRRMLARVTEITGPDSWKAVNADLDDAMTATGSEPHYDFIRPDQPLEGKPANEQYGSVRPDQ